ncbi:response regulator [Altericista sp. CCNU0014]|uniref:response regulator n=1 Tax=Altericista sp. CCNU0014 TaxID=3082949 RepID=UPI00384F5DB7
MQFQAGQLSNLIIQLERERFTGTALVNADVGTEEEISKVFAFWKGELTFVGDRLPSPLEFAGRIKHKLNITFMDSALKVLEGRVKNRDSVRELVDFINRFGLFKWEDLEPLIERDIVLQLETLLARSGEVALDREVDFDLSFGHDCHGFRWELLRKTLVQRQQHWQALSPFTPATVVSTSAGTGVLSQDIKAHLDTWVDGRRPISKIAVQTNIDSLELAYRYSKLFKQGWLIFPGAVASAPENARVESTAYRPVLLSVDDSPIVQVSIQRAISDRYEVLCAKSAVEALNLLNKHKVELLLLDVTMPDIDGLELCRTIRNIGKFRDLPVIMLTAKDGLIDKVKGQFAGSTHYMTKPVDREKLLPVLEKYIPVREEAA